MGYEVQDTIIERYADLLVNFALGGGQGIAVGDTVVVAGPEATKPLFAEICRAVWRAGGHTIMDLRLDDDATTHLARDFYEIASPEQLSHFPEHYYRGMTEQSDHRISLIGDADPHAMRDVDPQKMIARQSAMAPVFGWLAAKENEARFSWTVALYGTEAMAQEAQMSIEEYWEQIVLACYLDEEDPKAQWARVSETIAKTIEALGALPIERLRVRGADADLTITLGEQRKWLGGGGRNIPSFEIFTSPDWRGTEGWIRFSEPLYTHGNLVTGIELAFADGVVTRASAQENETLLTEMLAAPGANRIGEFSLTDGRLSRITKFMATTLFDENTGGRYGNTHLAVGRAYQTTYAGDATALGKGDWERLGFNDSPVHTDIVSTTDREVTAILADGSEQVIYADGRFQVGD